MLNLVFVYFYFRSNLHNLIIQNIQKASLEARHMPDIALEIIFILCNIIILSILFIIFYFTEKNPNINFLFSDINDFPERIPDLKLLDLLSTFNIIQMRRSTAFIENYNVLLKRWEMCSLVYTIMTNSLFNLEGNWFWDVKEINITKPQPKSKRNIKSLCSGCTYSALVVAVYLFLLKTNAT